MTVWVVTRDQGGAHEPDCVYSIWTQQIPAEHERNRLQARWDTEYGYKGRSSYRFRVVATEVDVSRNENIE